MYQIKIDRSVNELSLLEELQSISEIKSNLIKMCLNSQTDSSSILQKNLEAIQSLTQSQSILIQKCIIAQIPEKIDSENLSDEDMPF